MRELGRGDSDGWMDWNGIGIWILLCRLWWRSGGQCGLKQTRERQGCSREL